MTDYATYAVQGDGSLSPTGTVDARSPEAAISKVAKERHEQAGENAQANGTYVAILQKAVTTVNVSITPSVDVKLDSDRTPQPRKQKQEQGQNSQSPAEPVPA